MDVEEALDARGGAHGGAPVPGGAQSLLNPPDVVLQAVSGPVVLPSYKSHHTDTIGTYAARQKIEVYFAGTFPKDSTLLFISNSNLIFSNQLQLLK